MTATATATATVAETITTATHEHTFKNITDFLLTAQVGDIYTEVTARSITTYRVKKVYEVGEHSINRRHRMVESVSIHTDHHGRTPISGPQYAFVSDIRDPEVRGVQKVTTPEGQVAHMLCYIASFHHKTARLAVKHDVKRFSAKGLRAMHDATLAQWGIPEGLAD